MESSYSPHGMQARQDRRRWQASKKNPQASLPALKATRQECAIIPCVSSSTMLDLHQELWQDPDLEKELRVHQGVKRIRIWPYGRMHVRAMRGELWHSRVRSQTNRRKCAHLHCCVATRCRTHSCIQYDKQLVLSLGSIRRCMICTRILLICAFESCSKGSPEIAKPSKCYSLTLLKMRRRTKITTIMRA